MSRKGLDIETIVKTATELTDEKGFDRLTIKEVSERLGIKSPSLYNHVGSLSELKELVSSYVMEQVRDGMVKASMGQNGVEALKEMGRYYIRFAREHGRLYEIIQWMNVGTEEQSEAIFSGVMDLICDMAGELGVSELEAAHIIRTVRSLAHGFASVESHDGFTYPSSVESSYEYALDLLFCGIKASREEEYL